jgi:excisionase family DNA binding protein
MANSATLARALVDSFDDDALDALAELLAPRLAARLETPASTSPWLDAAGAAEYLSTSRDRVYDLVQLRKLEPRRDGRRLLFRRDDLDHYLVAS